MTLRQIRFMCRRFVIKRYIDVSSPERDGDVTDVRPMIELAVARGILQALPRPGQVGIFIHCSPRPRSGRLEIASGSGLTATEPRRGAGTSRRGNRGRLAALAVGARQSDITLHIVTASSSTIQARPAPFRVHRHRRQAMALSGRLIPPMLPGGAPPKASSLKTSGSGRETMQPAEQTRAIGLHPSSAPTWRKVVMHASEMEQTQERWRLDSGA